MSNNLLKENKDGSITYPYSVRMEKEANPNQFLPRNVAEDGNEELGIFPVNPAAKPKHDTNTQGVRELLPVKTDEGYVQQWEVVDLSAGRKMEASDGAQLRVRQERDKRLSASDWTQLSDNNLTEKKRLEWVTYRQALRDMLPVNDPFNPEFPDEPLDE